MKGSNLMKDFFVITVEEIQHIANKILKRYLDIEEIQQVQKRVQFGLECWEDVVITAIESLQESEKFAIKEK